MPISRELRAFRKLSNQRTKEVIRRLANFRSNRAGSKPAPNALRNYDVFITSDPILRMLLILQQSSSPPYPAESKLAEACASRTHRRHQRRRPPVLKITWSVLIGSDAF